MESKSSLDYDVSYRDIKYPRVELRTGKPLFVLPFGYKPDAIYKKHKNWVLKKINFIEECLSNAKDKKLFERSDEEFKKLAFSIVEKISIGLNLEIKGIYFRKMRTKWASLSSVKNLTVNKNMKYLPEYLIEYIIFHELTHIVEKNHNERFWQIISGKYKNYQEMEKELFEYWFKISEKSRSLSFFQT